MLTFDEVAGLLDNIIDGMPEILFRNLTGVYLVPELKYSDKIPDGEHIILGEYIKSQIGNQVHVYYGSVMEKWLDADVITVKAGLEHIVRHELRHHWEGMAGCDDLERLDAEYIRQKLQKQGI